MKAKPFLKWVGGKRQVLKWLAPMYPAPGSFARYHEPFLGGGAVFFDLHPPAAVLTDTNTELVDTYLAVRDRVEEVIVSLGRHVYDKDYYYEVRAWDPHELEMPERAARMIFLNKTGFNGLYRVNSRGIFNVPFGRYTNPGICNPTLLRLCSERLKTTEIAARSFEEVVDTVKRGDFVYFDPPYIPLSRTAGFTAYQKRGFGMDNQERLADVFERLDRKGARLMLSNSDVDWIKERYKGFEITVIKAARAVNSVSSKRGPVGELVVTNY